MLNKENMITRRNLFYVGVILCVLFIALFAMEYYAEIPTLHITQTKETKTQYRDKFYNVPYGLESKQYKNIIDYLENAEELNFNTDAEIGCFDNDLLLEKIKGTGNTCIKWAPRVFDIYYKKKAGDPQTNDKLNSTFVTNEGKSYSFAELCPVTSNQDRPLRCLYKNASQYTDLSTRVGNVIDNLQTTNNIMLDNIDSSIAFHSVDENRLYNSQAVTDYSAYERKMNMNKNLRNNIGDNLDDLSLYSLRIIRPMNLQ